LLLLFFSARVYYLGEKKTGHYQGIYVDHEKSSNEAVDFLTSIQFAWAVAVLSWFFTDLSALISGDNPITWVGWLGLGLALLLGFASIYGINRLRKRLK